MLLSALGDKQGKPVLAKIVGGRREGAQRRVNQRRPVQLECSQTQQRSAAEVSGTRPGRDSNYVVGERVWGRTQIVPVIMIPLPTYWKNMQSRLKGLDQVLWATRSPMGTLWQGQSSVRMIYFRQALKARVRSIIGSDHLVAIKRCVKEEGTKVNQNHVYYFVIWMWNWN